MTARYRVNSLISHLELQLTDFSLLMAYGAAFIAVKFSQILAVFSKKGKVQHEI
jgi:DNA-binding response OmpR family regulator